MTAKHPAQILTDYKLNIKTTNKTLHEQLLSFCKFAYCTYDQSIAGGEEQNHVATKTHHGSEQHGKSHDKAAGKHSHPMENIPERILFGYNVTGINAETVLFESVGIKIWHVGGVVCAVLLAMSILLASRLKCRIPRTRKQIEMDKKVQEVAKAYANELMQKMEDELETGVGGEEPVQNGANEEVIDADVDKKERLRMDNVALAVHQRLRNNSVLSGLRNSVSRLAVMTPRRGTIAATASTAAATDSRFKSSVFSMLRRPSRKKILG